MNLDWNIFTKNVLNDVDQQARQAILRKQMSLFKRKQTEVPPVINAEVELLKQENKTLSDKITELNAVVQSMKQEHLSAEAMAMHIAASQGIPPIPVHNHEYSHVDELPTDRNERIEALKNKLKNEQQRSY